MSDIRKGKVFLSTWWDNSKIKLVIIRHRRGNHHDEEESRILEDFGSYEREIPVMDITYDVSLNPQSDCWRVLIITDDWKVYTIKDDYFCNLKNDDNGNVHIKLNNGRMQMYVSFSSSDGCIQDIYKIGEW
ncbi:hypothetical protein [Xenorhabdus cabanillasii]|uniref:Uncharacterized protein n=2 Tax=Xenorhabdus cabanillasii TaxID=351673 RepID=A0A3D9UD70_9GAMM|nr:hypothetical protein [Xenorhabdus cabanillasii]PHM75789.1 hypothetical protein Xcab_03705 [Xenorhabdus cabanillasii JM26]REF27329.1 hypothetical protein BDD26_2097 [Xenorhabdus cabanillasii]CDL78949.1 hypothetical protein XCR1_100008 [Xenorhabdus cabanillasii JM26]